MTTLLLTHSDCLDHVTPPGHPEQVARLEAINHALADPAFDALLREECPLAEDAQVARAHPQAYIDAIRNAVPEDGWSSLDPDTHLSPGSLKAAGPFLDDDGNMTGSLVVIEASNRDEILAISQEDPYARAGLFESVEIRPWNWAIKNPEAS